MITVGYRRAKADSGKRSRAKNLNKTWPVLGVTVALIALVMIHTWQQSKVVSLKKGEFKLIQERTELEILNEQLRSELSSLRALDRIDRIAREELGLVPPAKTKTIVLPSKPDEDGNRRAKSR
jgi:cell division protein FtsL